MSYRKLATKIAVLATVVSAPLLVSSIPALAAENDLTIEEILVTATKRAESLQDVAMSVGVVTGEQIDSLGITGYDDIQSFVPNLVVRETVANHTIRIRGVGSSQENIAFNNAVGLFVDDIYAGKGRSFQMPFVDVERVEVARGPQGALFGKNTIGGAVSTISRRPGDEFETELTVGTELEEGGITVSGYVSGPLSDKLGARLAFLYEDIDGYVHNIATGEDDGAKELLALRGIVTFDPTDNVSIFAKAEGGYRDYDSYLLQPLGATTTEEFDDERNFLGLFDEERNDTSFFNATLQADIDVGGFTITSITGYQQFEFDRRVWLTPVEFIDNLIDEEYDQFSQELRLVSPTGGAIDFIVGAFYSKDDHNARAFSPADYGAIGLPFFGMNSSWVEHNGKTETFSVYGQFTWHVSEKLRLIGSARYSDETPEARVFFVPSGMDPATLLPAPGLNPFQDAVAGALPSSPFAAFFGSRQFDITTKRKDDFFDPSIAIEFDVNDDILLYASFARGSKGGGFMATSTTLGNEIVLKDAAWMNEFIGRTVTQEDLRTSQITLGAGNDVHDFAPEEADAFELGAKMRLFDGRGTLNVALFNTEYKDLQVSTFQGDVFVISNAGTATSKGVEIEFNMRLTEALTISANYGYLDATYDEYENAICLQADDFGTLADPNCISGQGSLTGRTLQYAPENEASLRADWQNRLTDGVLLRLGAAASFTDDYHVHDNEAPSMTQKSYTKYDAYVGIAATNDRWELTLLGRNLGDKFTLDAGYPLDLVGSSFRIGKTSSPRLITLKGTVRF